MAEFKTQVQTAFRAQQLSICKALEALDGLATFREDSWKRSGGGGGFSRIIEKGAVFEKGGVNFSAVYGSTPEKILKALKLEVSDFFATGVSIVLHPKSPLIPIIHMNVRYFEMASGVAWFGGGIDLTPIYVDLEQAHTFHKALKKTCDQFDPDYYPEFKQQADDYFYIKHRQETRGVGGIFFDRLAPSPTKTKTELFNFVVALSETFIPCYKPLVLANKHLQTTALQRKWQALRRGRYVEFNLVYDKGTKFGLDTDGRTESILMSLPPVANWDYDYQVESNSNEAQTLTFLKKNLDWIGLPCNS